MQRRNLNYLPEWKHLELSEDEINRMLLTGEIQPDVEQRLSEANLNWIKKWLVRFRAKEAECEHLPL